MERRRRLRQSSVWGQILPVPSPVHFGHSASLNRHPTGKKKTQTPVDSTYIPIARSPSKILYADEMLLRCPLLIALVVCPGQVHSDELTNNSEQLQAAVSKGHRLGAEERGVAAVNELLDKGLDVNAKDGAGWTALMMASLEGLPQVVNTLLARGADPNLRSKKGETALIIASGCFIVRTRGDLVLERGFAPDMNDRQLSAPRVMVEALLRRGAGVNAATSDGRTPLMTAAMHGWTDVMQVLIKAGANIHASDRQGRIAIDYANGSDASARATLLRAGSRGGTRRSGRTVCDAQAALNVLGLRSGHPDCWWGSSTAELVKKFQQQRGLPVSGELDDRTLKALGVKR